MKKLIIVATGVLLLGVAYLQFRSDKKPLAPKAPVVTSCKELKPGMRRLGEQYGYQFDVFANDFTIHEGRGTESDVYGFTLTRENGTSYLDISWRSERLNMGGVPVDPTLMYSGPFEKRWIFDDKGKQIGEDSWGYWGDGEFWRRVHLVGRVVASYGSINSGDIASSGSVHEKDAELFDQVINSVCRLTASGS